MAFPFHDGREDRGKSSMLTKAKQIGDVVAAKLRKVLVVLTPLQRALLLQLAFVVSYYTYITWVPPTSIAELIRSVLLSPVTEAVLKLLLIIVI